jgi:excisionase family DNA binding protein
MAASMWTPTELARALRVSPRLVINAIRSGRIDAVKVGRQWRITDEEASRVLQHGFELSKGKA